MRKLLVVYFLLVWAIIMAIQGVRAVIEALSVLRIGEKAVWVGASTFYAVMAYGAWRTFVFLRKPKKSN
jgi:hypothetical protein